jgi:bacteriochlorophyll 4-vinyl reductase
MLDAGIGRLLVASLHQGIAEVIPARLDFYEHWLRPAEGGDSRVSLASLGAVLSFLRREGQPAYDEVMAKAGSYSAEWTVAGLPAFKRNLVHRMPGALRARFALRVGRGLVRATYQPSRAAVRLRRRKGTVVIHDSIFCTLRTTSTAPMCSFYAAGVERLLALFRVPATVEVEECRAEGAAACRLVVVLGDTRVNTTTAEAA